MAEPDTLAELIDVAARRHNGASVGGCPNLPAQPDFPPVPRHAAINGLRRGLDYTSPLDRTVVARRTRPLSPLSVAN